MNLTKEQLLAGAQSNEHGGWRYLYDGQECVCPAAIGALISGRFRA